MLCAVESSKPTRSVDSEWLFGPKTGRALAAQPRSLDQRLLLAKGGVPTCVVAHFFRADSISDGLIGRVLDWQWSLGELIRGRGPTAIPGGRER